MHRCTFSDVGAVAVCLSAMLLGACAASGPDMPRQPHLSERELLLKEIQELHEESRVEYGFAMFVESLELKTTDTAAPRLPWVEGELGDLLADYTATATTVEPALAFHLKGTDGRRRNLTAMRQTLSYARPAMEELPDQRRRLSRLILEEVFGENDPWYLLQVESGQAIERDELDQFEVPKTDQSQ